MNSSFFITLIALAVVGAIAYFSAVGFRGAGKIKKVPRNLQKYLPDDELETTHLDKTLSIAVVLASLLTIMIPLYFLFHYNLMVEYSNDKYQQIYFYQHLIL